MVVAQVALALRQINDYILCGSQKETPISGVDASDACCGYRRTARQPSLMDERTPSIKINHARHACCPVCDTTEQTAAVSVALGMRSIRRNHAAVTASSSLLIKCQGHRRALRPFGEVRHARRSDHGLMILRSRSDRDCGTCSGNGSRAVGSCQPCPPTCPALRSI